MSKLIEVFRNIERRRHSVMLRIPTLREFDKALARTTADGPIVVVEPLIDVPSSDRPSGMLGVKCFGVAADGSQIACVKLIAQERNATRKDKADTSLRLTARVMRRLATHGIKTYMAEGDELYSLSPAES